MARRARPTILPPPPHTTTKPKHSPQRAADQGAPGVWERGVAIERAKREAAGKAPARQLREEDVRL